MKGREETNLRIESETKKLCMRIPQLIEYYYSMSDKTALTKHTYLTYIKEYMMYRLMEERGNFSRVYKDTKKSDIYRYLEHIKYKETKDGIVETSANTQAVKLAAIKHFYEFLVDSGYAENNPCEKIKPPRNNQEKEVIYLTKEEIEIIKNNIKKGTGAGRYKYQHEISVRDLAIFTLGYRTGLRVGAIREIDVDDVDFERKIITVVEKGNFTRDIYIGEETSKLIEEWLKCRKSILGYEKGVDALFISNRKQRICTKSIGEIFNKYTDGIDKKLSPHKMRSTHAVLLYEATNDIYQVAESLGHKNIRNTRRYVQVSESKKKASAEIMDKL